MSLSYKLASRSHDLTNNFKSKFTKASSRNIRQTGGQNQQIETSPSTRQSDLYRFVNSETGLQSEIAIKPMLKISNPNDPAEREADHIANLVIKRSEHYPTPILGVKGSTYSKETDYGEKNDPFLSHGELAVSKEASPNANENSATLGSREFSIVTSGGNVLDQSTRAFMEPRFGYNFSDVRIHTDDNAARSAESINALAYTVGNDIVFGQGQYQPNSIEGKRLIAHELTHVVQQGGNGTSLGLKSGSEYNPPNGHSVGTGIISGNNSMREEGMTIGQTAAPSSYISKSEHVIQRDADTPQLPDDSGGLEYKPHTEGETNQDKTDVLERQVTINSNYLFKEQEHGITFVNNQILTEEKPTNLLAEFASAAVAGAAMMILGPAGGTYLGKLVEGTFEEQGKAHKYVHDALDVLRDAVKAGVEGAVKPSFEGGGSTIANFISEQQTALSKAQQAYDTAMNRMMGKFSEEGEIQYRTNLIRMANELDVKSEKAKNIQIIHSIGAWTQYTNGIPDDDLASEWIQNEGPAKADINFRMRDAGLAENGALEITAATVLPPVSRESQIIIQKSNLKGMSREIEDVIKEKEGTHISDLNLNLRVTFRAMYGAPDPLPGEVRFESYSFNRDAPVVPEAGVYQDQLIWFTFGLQSVEPSNKDAASKESASHLAKLILGKPVEELNFGE